MSERAALKLYVSSKNAINSCEELTLQTEKKNHSSAAKMMNWLLLEPNGTRVSKKNHHVNLLSVADKFSHCFHYFENKNHNLI